MATTTITLISLLLFLSSSVLAAVYSGHCVYTVYIKTGSIYLGGTNSTISLRLSDVNGKMIDITNLVAWGGLMGPGHDYFARGNLDIFSGRGECLSKPVCLMNLTSDGSGSEPGWYCNYVEVTSTGCHMPCKQRRFIVEQWLSKGPSYQLTAIRNDCVD